MVTLLPPLKCETLYQLNAPNHKDAGTKELEKSGRIEGGQAEQ
jgi:hypothetical protein